MINAYCVDEITILKSNGYDSWSEPLSGTIIDIRARVEWKTRLVRDINGEQVVSTITVLIPRRVDVLLNRHLSLEDRIQIGGQSFDRAIIEIGTPKAFAPNTSAFGIFYEVALA